MQFLVLAYDATDDEALERRMEAREAHLALAEENQKTGHALYGAAILDDDGKMIGSMMVVEYPDEEALKDWLAEDPYVTGSVWQDLSVQACKVAPSFEK